MKTYIGFRTETDCQVWVMTGRRKRELLPARSLKVRNHSPTGFEWGYSGSGPAQLALAILLDVGVKDAAARYQDFKFDVIAGLQRDQWKISQQEIEQWLRSAKDQRSQSATSA